MTDYFLRSTDGSDSDTGLSWALAKATMASALTAMAAGDTLYVSDNHSESTAAAITLTSPGTAANYVRILCVDDTGDPASPTTLATGALVATTGSSAINFAGFAYCYGVTFQSSSAANIGTIALSAATPFGWVCEAGVLKVNGSSASGSIDFGAANTAADDCFVHLINTQLSFAATSQTCRARSARFVWEHTASAIQGSVPTTLFTPTQAMGHYSLIRGVDLSAAGSGKNLVSIAAATPALYRFRNCKLGASVAITTGTPPSHGGVEVELYNCDSGDTNYRHERHEYNGTQVVSTTVYRSGGASNGTTPLSWLITGARTQRFLSAFTSMEMRRWQDSTGSKTCTISYIHGESAALDNDQIWMKLDYLGDGSFPVSSVARDRKSTVLATAAAQSADTGSDWDDGVAARANSTAYSLGDIRRPSTPSGKLFVVTTAGTSAGSEPGGFTGSSDGDSVTDNTVTWRQMRREKLDVTVTINEKGVIYAVVELAANVQVFVDPLIVVS